MVPRIYQLSVDPVLRTFFCGDTDIQYKNVQAPFFSGSELGTNYQLRLEGFVVMCFLFSHNTQNKTFMLNSVSTLSWQLQA